MLSEPSARRYVTIPRLKIITPANGEPLGIQDYLNAANITIKKHVDNLAQKIVMAREAVESYTGRSLLTCTVDQLIDYDAEEPMDILSLRKPPVRKVVGVYTYDPYGNESTVDPSVYFVSKADNPFTKIGLLPGQIWGTFLTDFECFRIRTISGYATLVTNVDATANTLTAIDHPYIEGDLIRLQVAYDNNTAPVVPGGLALYTNYYAKNVSGNTLQLSATSGGSAIDITDTGAGKLFIGEIPEKLRRAVMITATYDFLNNESDSTGIEGTAGIPEEVRDLVREYKRTWL